MTSDQFAYWLQGFFELTNSNQLTEKQVLMIKEHLQLVFTKITPDHNDDDTACTDIAARDEGIRLGNATPTFKGKPIEKLTYEELVEAQRLLEDRPPFESMGDESYNFLRAVIAEKFARDKTRDNQIREIKAEWDALAPDEKVKRHDEFQAKWESHRAVPFDTPENWWEVSDVEKERIKHPLRELYSKPHDPRGCRNFRCHCKRRYC